MNLSLTGKQAVICGSSQGIGFAIAEELALLGAVCILIARNEALLQTAVDKLSRQHGQEHSYAVADFSNSEEVRKAIQTIIENRPVDILINNTGGPKAGLITEAGEEEFISAFNQHLINNHILTQAVIPSMKKEGYGRIINIISTSVKIPLSNLGVSNTIRGAVASWAKTMANELAQYNITVNNILPGLTKTARLDSLIKTTATQSKKDEDAVIKNMVESIPMKRFGEPAELAAVAAFLASPAASYITGVSIAVDGGRTGSL